MWPENLVAGVVGFMLLMRLVIVVVVDGWNWLARRCAAARRLAFAGGSGARAGEAGMRWVRCGRLAGFAGDAAVLRSASDNPQCKDET